MRVGVLGGGQLAWMMGLAAQPLGIDLFCWDTQSNTTASHISPVLIGDFSNNQLLEQFLQQADVVTIETENIPLALAEAIAKKRAFYPGLLALEKSQDRYFEKMLFQALSIPTPKFYPIDNYQALEKAIVETGFPAVLKTRRFGYDGKGQYIIKKMSDLKVAWDLLGEQSLILEAWVNYTEEVSLIAVRNKQGKINYYPLALNEHKEGILRTTKAPYQSSTLQANAEKYMKLLMDKLKYVGVMTIEFFVKDNQLLANEIAPRVHNSGHWTIEGAVTSQFANHIRAICDLPLGDTSARANTIMHNMIGEELDIKKVLETKNASYYSYRKTPRPNRKMGHITVIVE